MDFQIIMKSENNPLGVVWTGGGWSSEYPDGKIFNNHWLATKAAIKLAIRYGQPMHVVDDADWNNVLETVS